MIIGLSGYAQVGKDTVANYLVENYGYKRVAFADPLREALYNLNPVITDLPEVFSSTLSNAVDHIGWETVKQNSEQVRGLLQRMGTEVGRKMFGEDFWVNLAFKNVYKGSKIVFTDVRFPNEFDAIKSVDGKIWRVEKPGIQAVNRHSSETALDNHFFDRGINNDSSIEDLHKAIDLLMLIG